jgi:enoyl-CoA hydratase
MVKMTEEKKYENILYEKKEKVARITFNRPKSLNALNTALLTELRDALGDAEADVEVRAVVITGAGDRAFCAGVDISELLERSSTEASEWLRWAQGITTYIEKIKKPIIAKVNGFCLGGGLELAMACDFRIASEKAIFGLPEINLAIIPGGGGTQRLTRLIGKTKAMEMLMCGEHIDAEEAFRVALVNKVVSADKLDSEVDELVKKLLSKSPVTLGIIKDAVNKGIEMNLERALQYEVECFGSAFATEDAREGLKAFLEKRKAEFKGK